MAGLMRVNIFLLVVIMLFVSGCNNRGKFGFVSGNCNEVYSVCMNKCLPVSKRNYCINSCNKSKAMCGSNKVKGCMQDCNIKYKKATRNAELCKQRCI